MTFTADVRLICDGCATVVSLLRGRYFGHDSMIMTTTSLACLIPLRGLLVAGFITLGLGGCSLIDGLQGEGEPGTSNPGGSDGSVNPLCPEGTLQSFLTVETVAGPADLFYEGMVTISQHDPLPDSSRLTLELDNGGQATSITFNYRMADFQQQLILDGATLYQASIAVQMPFYIDAALVLREDRGAGGTEGPLVVAMWDFSENLLSDSSLQQVTVDYVSTNCAPMNDGCGDRAPLDLDVKLPNSSQPVRLSPGNETFADGFKVVNSAGSGEYVGPLNCSDTPTSRMIGYIVGPLGQQ